MSWQLSSLRWPPVDGEPEPHREAEAGSLSPDLSGSPRDGSAAEHSVLWEPSQQFWSQTLCVFGLACSESSRIMSRRPKALREMGILYLMEPRARNLGAWRSLDGCPVQPPMAHHMASGKHTSTDRECSASPLLSHSSHPIPPRSILTLWTFPIQFNKIQQTCTECALWARHHVKLWGRGSELPRYLPPGVSDEPVCFFLPSTAMLLLENRGCDHRFQSSLLQT